MAPARSYLPTPSTFWTPSVPSIERHVDVSPSNPVLWALRLLRLYWITLTFPLHILLVFISTSIPTFPLPITVSGRHRHWTPAQRVFYPFIQRFLWAIAGTGGGPADISAEWERKIPISSKIIEWAGGLFGARQVHIWSDDAPALSSEAAGEWIMGEAVDPRGEVQPAHVPCFWADLERQGNSKSRSDRVVMYLVGGGYTSGSPAEGNRMFELARETGLCIMGGLAMTLLFYLTTTLYTSHNPPSSLIIPTALLLYSPWCDLTLASYRAGIPPSYQDDFLNPTMLNYASEAYLSKTFPRDTDIPLLGLPLEEHRHHPFTLGAAHPFFSPALPSAKPILSSINNLYRGLGKTLSVMVVSGSAEVFTPEIEALVQNLEKAPPGGGGGATEKEGGIRVEWREEPDELHVFMMCPRWISPAAGRSMKAVVEFLAAL
ncbi:hypothetical protein RQP46_011080 [Phenoliferia psychrophenolica]